MLLAGPSQTTTYPNAANTSSVQYSPAAVSRLTISSSSTVSKSNDSVGSPSSSSRFGFMKSISSQLNRGTELLKQTVQRAIFSSKITVVAAPTAKPTKYHSDPHAVLRSSSVDSLRLETCHIRPIRPYSLTPYRRSAITMCCPVSIRPEGKIVLKFSPMKVKARFRLQKANQLSAFCAFKGSFQEATVSVITPPSSPQKSTKTNGRGTKRKLSLDVVVDEDSPRKGKEEKKVQAVQTISAKRGKKSVPDETQKSSATIKKETKKSTTKAAPAGKRKSLEQEKQEREDFELAKKLQKEFDTHSIGGDTTISNATTVSVRRTRNGRSLTNSVATNYSLRTTRSLSKISSPAASPVNCEGEEREKGRGKGNKITPPTKNGLKTRNINHNNNNQQQKKKNGKEINGGEQQKNKKGLNGKSDRTTRSKGGDNNCKGTK